MKHSCVTITAILVCSLAVAAPMDDNTTVLMIIVDGLRPDYITPELMPNVHRLAEDGVFCESHHAIYPTVTRVNSSTFSTGAYPKTHGLMGNSVYFPEVDPDKALNTGDAANLMAINRATGGNLLTAPTLGELLAARGYNMLACSAGSSGSAMLMNHTGAGGGVVHYSLVLPESNRDRMVELLGPDPGDAYPSIGRNTRATDAYVKAGLDNIEPKVAYIWFTDPDHTAHKHGVGAPVTNDSLRAVDAQIGRILKEHEKRGMHVNIFITSDHGFSTQTGGLNLLGPLLRAGLKRSPSSSDVLLVGGAVYVNEGGDEAIKRIVKVYQEEEGVGALFTRAKTSGSDEGWVEGTLSFDLIHWNHERSADILVDAKWTSDRNEHGYAGMTNLGGVAGHGTASKWDIYNTLIAYGPDIKRGFRNPAPTGNVNMAPTIAYLCGIDPPDSMDGRVMKEILDGGPSPDSLEVEENEYAASAGGYTVTVSASYVDGHRYINYARAKRE